MTTPHSPAKTVDHKRVAVIGGGWSGLAAAVEATRLGATVTLFEMAPQWGGRARTVAVTVDSRSMDLDNGQHILIGAYTETLSLMRAVGVDPEQVLLRMPMRIVDERGTGLVLPPGSPSVAFARAIWSHSHWTIADRFRFSRQAALWVAQGFRCDTALTVAQLTQAVPVPVQNELIEPLCMAALNTPTYRASASVFLRVLKDALFSTAQSADLLLPQRALSTLFPAAASLWLEGGGATLRLGHRVMDLARAGEGWDVNGEHFDAVICAATAAESARLIAPIRTDWSLQTQALGHEPIATVYLHAAGAQLNEAMLALPAGPNSPAQFVFDLGRLQGRIGVLAFVVSAAQAWVELGTSTLESAVMMQARRLTAVGPTRPLNILRTIVEKRATFSCTPALHRPQGYIAEGFWAAGDYIDGPYPSTLEGAVRSGLAAATAVLRSVVAPSP